MCDLIFLGAIQEEFWLNNGKNLSRNYAQGVRVYDSNGIATTISQGGGIGGAGGLYLILEVDRDSRNSN